MTDKPPEFKDRVRGFAQWVKVIVLVALITLLVVLLLQNISAESTLVFIVPSWTIPTALTVAASFVAGVLVTLLAVLLRRGSGKQ